MVVVNLLSVLSSLLFGQRTIRAENPIHIFLLNRAQQCGFYLQFFLVLPSSLEVICLLIYGSLCTLLNVFFVCYSSMKVNELVRKRRDPVERVCSSIWPGTREAEWLYNVSLMKQILSGD